MRRADFEPPHGFPIHFSNSQIFNKPTFSNSQNFSNKRSRFASRNLKASARASRREAPESLKIVSPPRGRAGCRVPDAPAASCAKKGSTSAHKYSQRRHRKTRHSRTRWCYEVYRALLGEVLIAPVVPRIKVLSAPGWADEPPQDLTPASGAGPHGLFVHFSIVRPARSSSTHRLNLRAACPANSDHARYRRVHRISPRVCDDRETPLVWDETN